MPESDNLLFAVGCVFLVTWYGVTRFANRRPTASRPHDSQASRPTISRDAHRAALEAEFRQAVPELVEEFPGGTVVCEECGDVFPAGVLYCSCGGETVEYEFEEEEAAQAEETTAPSTQQMDFLEERLVIVDIAENHWKASLMKSFLESHDIPCATGGNSSSGPYQFNIGPMGEVKIYVYEQHERVARLLLHDVFYSELKNKTDDGSN